MDPFEADSLTTADQKGTTSAAIEAGVLSALAVGLGALARPDDPLAIDAAFPWSIFAVALVGLRYGFPMALLTTGLLHLGAMVAQLLSAASTWPLPFEFSVGCAVLSVVCGEYRESWGRRLDTVERSNAYRQARLEEFTQTYHVLKLSHDRLEQDNAGNQTSLRSSLLTVRSLFVPGSELEANAEAILELFRRYCAVVSGAFYVLEDGQFSGKPAAEIGRLNEIDPHDELLVEALATGTVSSVNPGRPDSMLGRTTGDPLIVVPFIDSFRKSYAVLIVTELPFFSYTERTLQLMAILAGQVADYTRDRHTFPEGLDFESATFASETLRSLEYAQNHGLPTTLVALKFTDQAAAPGLIATIDAQSRGLDRVLSTGEVGDLAALLIMPLTGAEEFTQFLPRFEGYLMDAHGGGSAALGIEVAHCLITASSTPTDVAIFMDEQLGGGHALGASLRAIEAQPEQAHCA